MKTTVRKKTYNLDGEIIEKVRRLFHSKDGYGGDSQGIAESPGRLGDSRFPRQGSQRRSLSNHLPMKYLLDTNVYLEACRSEETRNRFRTTFFPLLPATFLSAVVAYESLESDRSFQVRGNVA